VEKAGGHVHFADTASDVLEVVTGLIREKNAQSVVKSESMVSEKWS
jgi:L-lactate dehydrogenase complex protein LldF